ncbi:EamA family transporter [Larkinella knui]|uniref:EamA family transporter n=1 Tax=Larkinella knui TaxID=2025310 RepID=A0A3P1CWN8_9BACT|nr:EamA family transporter [Larkinella knui]RRB17500.1 EamA family transporter [Larkinella knui]
MTQPQPKPWLILLAFAAVYIIWGSTYLAALLGLASIPPFLMASLRFLIAGILLFGYCLLKGDSKLTARDLGRNALSGVLMLFGGTVSVIWAEQYMPSGLAAILVTTLPFWFVILDRRQWRHYFANWMIPSGVVIGFAGVVLLLAQPGQTAQLLQSSGQFWVSVGVLLTGGIFWTFGSLYAKYKPASSSTVLNGSFQLLSAGTFSGLVSLLSGELTDFQFDQVLLKSWLALVYMIAMGSIVTYLAYLWLLKVRPPAVVSTYAYVNPVIAVLLGGLFANESISVRQLLALVVILTGVLLVNLPNYQRIRKPVGAKV